jgi:hypothetical protein
MRNAITVVHKITPIPSYAIFASPFASFLISSMENGLMALGNILLIPLRKIKVVMNNAYTTPYTRT